MQLFGGSAKRREGKQKKKARRKSSNADDLDDIFASVLDSLHVAPFSHGLELHSITSSSQFPSIIKDVPVLELFTVDELSITVHSVAYSSMKSYSHTPLAKPAAHVHLYSHTGMVASLMESSQTAPFWHGNDRHSSTSTSQLPPVATAHCAVYCATSIVV